ncbi:MAG: polysaccharide deacetylase family protein [Altibacter sp.]|uniref:polysaccharide deacetylase family protein n=1 Tax=Altibacter sp. TaxID=2024823 RepID=UPI001DB70D1E|nr:polysaccharide deacetylase family protein [Altibacter sp.]MBZ0328487.1 polysaccharide deacetylase family protein [Altibacter sp.]
MLKFNTINKITLGVAVLLLFINFLIAFDWIYYVILGLSWLLITAMGSAFIGWNYHLPSLNKNKHMTENWVSITFDDGPNPQFTPAVLSLLKKHEAKATFFCVGKNLESHPEIVQQILSEGHTIGNHTYSHAYAFGFFSSEKVVQELEQTNKVVKDTLGLALKLYRPAFGITNPNIKKALKVTGLTSIGWSKRSFDTTMLSEAIIFKRITRNLQKGDIILLHDSSKKTIAVLEQLLLFLQTNHLKSVTVDQLLNIEPYA